MLLAKRKNEHSGNIDVTISDKLPHWNVIALSFFSNAVPSRKTIHKLVPLLTDYHVTSKLKFVIYEHERKTCVEIVDSFARYIKKFCFDLVLHAMIWNKPEALKTIIGTGIDHGYPRKEKQN
ncbi:MAG: hypothetical protein AB2693_32300 [Candidatus Thiodiazotropha sp.]